VVTALVRYTLRAVTVQVDGASAALRSLNEVLLRHRAERFCTVVLLRVRRVDGVWAVSLSSAGHPLPLLVRPGRAPVQAGEPGSLLGVLETIAVHDTEVRLEPGSALLLYTDGVTEARREQVFYGQGRLVRLAGDHRGDAAALTAAVLEDVLSFQDGVPRDDVAVVVVRVPDAAATV
jgi:sigma-B regulation protein RsbU (phosphoserine phosphatase)